MKQTARIISTYSADAFGVCSALFELGGMTIIHDASGCNSTYTTHDEPRWYDMDSMVYISALTEMEAIMGDDDKLIGDICDAAEQLHPAFIAICGTPIPMMTGFDFAAVAEVIESRTGIPAFGFPTSGMKTYIDGASMALEGVAERLVREVEKEETARPLGMITRSASGSSPVLFEKFRVNILGLTPLDFSVNGTDEALCSWLRDNGFEVVSRWAMKSSLEELSEAGLADVNLVVSAAGLGAARTLYRRFGIPYVVGLPVGAEQGRLVREALEKLAFRSRAVRHSDHPDERAGGELINIAAGHAAAKSADAGMQAADAGEDMTAADAGKSKTSADANTGTIVLIGEGITNLAIANAVELATGRRTKVLCATECPEELLRDGDRLTPDEDDIIPELEGAGIVIADPLYRPICPDTAKFIPLPTEAFSGRIFRDDIPDLISDFDWLLSRL